VNAEVQEAYRAAEQELTEHGFTPYMMVQFT
jgi:hypothetical protein